MEFQGRSQVLQGQELMELVAISPEDDAMRTGFQLQDPEVDDVLRTARDLGSAVIAVDPSLSPDENTQVLLRAVRMLQLGMEVQLLEQDNNMQEINGLRDELQMLEDRSRALEEEVAELREAQDRDGLARDPRVAEKQLRELEQLYEDEKRSNDQLIEEKDQLIQEKDAAMAKLDKAEKDMEAQQKELLDNQQRLQRLQEDFDIISRELTDLKAQGNTKEQQKEMQETIRQQDWKIDRLTKDNRALEAANVELRSKLEELKDENLQVSEKIVALDEELKQLQVHEGELHAKMETLAREKTQLMAAADELRAEVADKMELLDEFEDRFKRQYRSWEEEKQSLMAQIESLKKEARLYLPRARRTGEEGGEDGALLLGDGAEDNLEARLIDLKQQLDASREKEVLLLEAYEQLELDVGKEVDRALGRQAEEVQRLTRRVTFLEGHLEKERAHIAVLEDKGATLEAQLEDALARNAQYESGVYGLPQAALEIKELKRNIMSGQSRVKELVQQINKLSAALEDLNDENSLLRRKAGIPEGAPLDIQGLKMQKEITIAQLRSVNALLERQVSDLEEERRKLRLEVKFRAKYHGKAALEMGLSPEQLLLLEEYVEGLKGNRNPEERLVTQLQQRILFLEVRLAEVMAYADIPINMRPTLIDMDGPKLPIVITAPAPALPAALPTAAPAAAVSEAGAGGQAAAAPQQQAAAVAAAAAAAAAASVPVPAAAVTAVKHTQLDMIKTALLNSIKMLKQMSQSLAEHRQLSDDEYHSFTNSVIEKLVDAERLASMLLKEAAAGPLGAMVAAQDRAAAAAALDTSHLEAATAAAAAAHAAAESLRLQQLEAQAVAAQAHAALQAAGAGVSGLVDAAAAEELRGRLVELSRQVVDLQVAVAQKDAQLAHLQQHQTTLQARLAAVGVSVPVPPPVAPVAPPVGLTQEASMAGSAGGYPAQHAAHQQQLGGAAVAEEVAALREQLVEALEELDARERELSEMQGACGRYQVKMQELHDQVKLLYRDYANTAANWRMERETTQKQLSKAREEAQSAQAANQELEAAIAVLETGSSDEAQKKYIEAVRRMAVVQLKHAKVVRELEASVAGEKHLQERVDELKDELQDVSSTCRSRIRWLEAAAQDATRRTEQLYRALQQSAPLDVYAAMLEKHKLMCVEYRKLLEERGDGVAASSEELLEARGQLAALSAAHEAAANELVGLREKLRQMELPSKLAGAAGGGGSSSAGVDTGALVAQALNQDLVAAQVAQEGLVRRLEMGERERGRIQDTLHEAQDRVTELEARLAQTCAELATSRAVEVRLQQRLAGSKTAAEVEALYARLDAAESAAARADDSTAALTLRAEEAERRAAEALAQRQRHLADLTSLRAAMREMMGQSDASATMGKLHLELDHCRAKESFARAALNRSELERLELDRQCRGLRAQLSRLSAQLSVQQDHARWAESELQQAHAQLELGLAARTETWKASLWARKLQQLKGRNDLLAGGLGAALRQLGAVADQLQAAELQLEVVQEVEVIMSRGASDVARQAAGLKQAQVSLKLELGRLTRQDLLMKQKVSFLERVNAELSEMLDKFDVESLAAAESIAAEKQQLAGRARQLQEEVLRLQERLSGYMAELDELKAGKVAAGSLYGTGGGGTKGPVALTAGAAERDMMLKQIESLKEARQEAEHLRQECRRGEQDLMVARQQLADMQSAYDDVLDRLAQQSSAMISALDGGGAGGVPADEHALQQLRAVAEASLRDLQGKVADRDRQIQELSSKLAEHQAAYMAQHAADRAEIERLNNKLLDSGAASIAGLKATLQKAGAALAAAGDGKEEVPYEQLRALLEERSGELEVLRNRLEQREASLDLLRRNAEAQARRYESELASLRGELASMAPKEEAPSRSTLQRLASELKVKDERLKQLRAAIKALEGKLASLLKEKTDLVMAASSWKEQEMLDERIAELEGAKAALTSELAGARSELAAAQQSLAGQEGALRRLQEALKTEKAALAAAKEELAKEQAALRVAKARSTSRLAWSSAGDAPSSTTSTLQRQVTDLQQQLADLQQEKAALLDGHKEEAAAARLAGPGAHGTWTGPGGGRASGPGKRGSATGLARAGGSGEGLDPGTPGGARDTTSSPLGRTHTESAAEGEEAGPLSRESSGAGGEGGLRGSMRPGADASAAAVQHWEQMKKVQARLEATKRKLASSNEELERATKELARREGVIAALTRDKDAAVAAMLAARQAATKAAAEGKAGGQQNRVDVAKLKDYVEKVLSLEDQCEQLRQQLATLQRQQQQQPPKQQQPEDAHKQQQQLFELRLQRDSAQAAVKRLEQHLLALFGEQAAGTAGSAAAGAGSRRPGSASGVAAGTGAAAAAGEAGGGGGASRDAPPPARRTAAGGDTSRRASEAGGSSGGAAKASSVREMELLSTITNLKAALERAMASSTPTSKYMQEVQRRKEAAREAAAAKEEVGRVQQQLAAATTRATQLQQENAELRGALTAAQQQAAAALAASGGPAQLQQLSGLLAQREAQVTALKGQVAQLEQRLAAVGAAGGAGEAAVQLTALRARVAQLEADNQDLRSELGAFDPAFFEEIEDLKHEHYQLTQKCAAQELQIAQLQQQLTVR